MSVLDDLQVRVLRTADELSALPELERLVWGSDREMVSLNVLVATIHEGGMALGAYAGDVLVGMVYGFATREPNVLHSHYLAVHPDWRRIGLGAALKYQQRDWCLRNGYTVMRWTFDPLQFVNAHLNLVALGAIGIAYHPNFYGELGGINGSLPSDRMMVHWSLLPGRRPFAHEHRVPLPEVTAADVAAGNVTALGARMVLRRDLAAALDEGWFVTGIDLQQRHYLLER